MRHTLTVLGLRHPFFEAVDRPAAEAGGVGELLLREVLGAALGPQHRPEPPEAVLGSGGTLLVRPVSAATVHAVFSRRRSRCSHRVN